MNHESFNIYFLPSCHLVLLNKPMFFRPFLFGFGYILVHVTLKRRHYNEKISQTMTYFDHKCIVYQSSVLFIDLICLHMRH